MTDDKLYKETRIYTTTQGTEVVSAMLSRLGVDGVCIEDRADLDFILSEGNKNIWDFADESLLDTDAAQGEATVVFYTEDSRDGDAILATVREGLMKLKADEQYGDYGKDANFGRLYSVTNEIGDGWKTQWKDYFRPFRITEKFIVCPPWETNHPFDTQGTETVIIDPGMAFGTGNHETTAMCAYEITKHVQVSSIVLDIGTGSGILSIVAAKAGARSVTAIDIDDDAIRSASENVSRNGQERKVKLIKGDITVQTVRELLVSDAGERGFDLICANLTGTVLKHLMPAVPSLLAEGGRLVMSGMLDSEGDAMLAAIAEQNLRLYSEEIRGEWLMLCVGF